MAIAPIDPQSILPSQAALQQIANPPDLEAQRLKKLQLQAEQMELADKQKARAANDALNSAWQSSTTIDPVTGKPKTDRAALFSSIAKAGHGSYIPGLNKQFDELDKSQLEMEKLKADQRNADQAFRTSKANVVSNLAANIKEHKYDPVFAHQSINAAHSMGMLDDDETPMLHQTIEQAGPDGMPKVIDGLISPEQQEKLAKAERDRIAAADTHTTAGLTATKTKGEIKKQGIQDAATQLMQVVGTPKYKERLDSITDPEVKAEFTGLGDNPTLGQVANVPLTAKERIDAANAAEQRRLQAAGVDISRANLGVSQGQLKVAQDREAREAAQAQGAMGTDPGTWDPNYVQQLDQVVDGRKLLNPRDKNYNKLWADATMRANQRGQVFDETAYKTRLAAQNSFAPNGNNGKVLTGFDVAAQHLKKLKELSDEAGLVGYLNPLSPAGRAYHDQVEKVAEETMKGIKGGVASKAEIESFTKGLLSVSKDVRNRVIQQNAGDMADKVGTMENDFLATVPGVKSPMPGRLKNGLKIFRELGAPVKGYEHEGSEQVSPPGSTAVMALPKGNGKVLDKATGTQFYKAAGGDPVKAQALAEQYGWKVQ